MVHMTLEEAHEILGVRIGDDETIIKTAYKKMALKTHPDKNPHDPNARINFQRISEAYKRITEPESFEEEEGEMNFEDLNEMFMAMFSEMMPNMMFGGRGGGGAGGLDFGMLEMMMAGMMMNEMGYGDEDEYHDEFYDEDDEHDDIRAMEAMLGMGMGGMGDMGIDMAMLEKMGFLDDEHDYDDEDEEDDDDEYYPQISQQYGGRGQGPGSRGGRGGPMGGMDMDMMMMLAMLEGMDTQDGWGGPSPHGRGNYPQSQVPKQKTKSASNRGKKDDEWLTASEDSEEDAKKSKGKGKKGNKSKNQKKKQKSKKEQKKSTVPEPKISSVPKAQAAPAPATQPSQGDSLNLILHLIYHRFQSRFFE